MEEARDPVDLSSLIERAQSGDTEAIDCLQGLEQEIRMMVRVRLPQELRTQFDSMDFVQDVWQSFFRVFHEDPERLRNVQHLRGFLAGVARNKVFEEHRRQTKTRKYDLGRQEPLYIRRGDREVPRDVPSRDASPMENAEAQDRLAKLLAGQHPRAGEILELRRQGLTFEEIATRVGLNERTVRRVVDTIKRGLP